MYSLVKFCKLRHESAAAGSYFLDVAVSKGLIQTPNDYQLGAMTALYLGLKVFDSPSMRVVKLSSLVKLGSGEFDEHDVIQMESELLTALEWRLNPPTPNCFLQQYLLLLPEGTLQETRNTIEELSFQAIEISISRDCFVSTDPSVLAYSAMLIAFEQMDQTDMSLWQLSTFLYNMANVAKMDNTSQRLAESSILLDRTMRSLHIPLVQEKVASGEASDPHHVNYGQNRTASGVSPNNVALQ
jgi:hypothetical protein